MVPFVSAWIMSACATLGAGAGFGGFTEGPAMPVGPVKGLVVESDAAWVESLGCHVVAHRAVNTTDVPVHVSRLPISEWTWRIDESGFDAYRPLAYRNDLWYGSTYWTGPDWTRVGKDWHHPGAEAPSIRRFVAPADGQAVITGRVYKADTNCGDGVRASVRLNEDTLWEAEIDGNDATGVQHELIVDLHKGDSIRFVVHKRGDIPCDTTHWDPTVGYADGAAYRASEGFAAEQGQGGCWHYEMESSAVAAWPKLHMLDPDMCALAVELRPDTTRRIDASEHLPLFFVENAAGTGGTLIAVPGPSPWVIDVTLATDGAAAFRLVAEYGEDTPLTLDAGSPSPLPGLVIASFTGSWLEGMGTAGRLLQREELPCAGVLREAFASAFGRLVKPLGPVTISCVQPCGFPELDYWFMIQDEWLRQDALRQGGAAYRQASRSQMARAETLLASVEPAKRAAFAEALRRVEAVRPGHDPEHSRSHYLAVRWLKREIMLANPLLDFNDLLFCKRVPTSYSHLVMQYFGWRARPGGGLFILERPGQSLSCRDILDGQLATGNVLEPRLSWDGKRVVFSHVRDAGRAYDIAALDNQKDEGFYHIYEVNVDGTGLRQITEGPYDDVMPSYLPDGGIVFCSTRRGGYARCFGAQFSNRWHTYTLHRMEADGSDLRTLSFNDVSEWFPTPANDGRILYSRWDYIDRDAVTHQNLWATRPDGTNPVTVWGNATPSPHCTFQMQPVPGSQKIVFVASAHHSITGGSIVLLDPAKGVDGEQALTRLTPHVPFPEAETRDIPEYYAAPWPLSEKLFLVAYSPKPLVWEPDPNHADALGIYLLDDAGDQELIYRDPAIGSTNPCPLRPRTQPPVLPGTTTADDTGEVFIANIYEGLGDVPPGSITHLRVVQIFPKSTPVAGQPPIGLAHEENGRAVLGTAPVGPDGSVRITVPARKPILFQALDADGFAHQTMRSLTYLQPGERVSCSGCHENRLASGMGPQSAHTHASALEPGPFGGEPFSFMRVVQPVLNAHCVTCHSGPEPKGGIDLSDTPHQNFTRSYWALCGDADFSGEGTNPEMAAKALVPRFGARNQIQVTPPGGLYGARGSRLIAMLRAGHQKVALEPDEVRRLALWIDMNAIFYGVNMPEDQARQLRGETVGMPALQ